MLRELKILFKNIQLIIVGFVAIAIIVFLIFIVYVIFFALGLTPHAHWWSCHE